MELRSTHLAGPTGPTVEVLSMLKLLLTAVPARQDDPKDVWPGRYQGALLLELKSAGACG